MRRLYEGARWPPGALAFGGLAATTAQLALTLNGHPTGQDRFEGSYGSASKAACEAFQSAKGLDVDGVVGPATIAALMA